MANVPVGRATLDGDDVSVRRPRAHRPSGWEAREAMKAICIEDAAIGPELRLRDVAEPAPAPTDLLVRVRAASVNFADLYRAANHYGHGGVPGAAVAGLEMAGEVVATGAEVPPGWMGARVMAMASRAYAELCTVDHRLAMRVPAPFSWDEAAAASAAFMTAHDALVTNARLQPGEVVLIEAVTSGIGLAALAVARHHGARLVLGTSGSPEKLARVRSMGLDAGINYKEEDVPGAVHAATAGAGADVIIGNAGGQTLPDLVKAAAIKGRIINVGRLGQLVGEIDLNEHSRKRLSLIGVTFRTRSLEEHAEVVRKTEADLGPLMQAGQLRPLVDRTFPLAEAAEAQEFVRAGRHFGKVVLTV